MAGDDASVARAHAAVLEGVGREVAASFPGITRLGGQVVAAMYLADRAVSMDELCATLARSKSNVFSNLRGLEAAGIVERRRVAGVRHDAYALRGAYPDVLVGAYLARLRRVALDKVSLCRRALGLLGDAPGPEADALRAKLTTLLRKYERFGELFELLPNVDGPLDLEGLLDALPEGLLETLVKALAGSAKRAVRRR